MGLSIGELVGFIRADDGGWRSGLDSARLRLRGLRRDADGTLRDLRGRFVSEGEAAGRGLGDGIRAHADLVVQALRRVGPAVAAIGAGVPAVAAVTVALGGLVAGAVSAGAAVRAFQLAAKPQLEDVAEVADLAAQAEEAVAEGAADAAEKQAAYEAALNRLPPATRDTAREFVGLKRDFAAWSDSLSGTTMPVFTKALQILRGLLPALTPLVQAAAGAFSDFLDSIQERVEDGTIADFAEDLAENAEENLGSFLRSLRNVVVGFAGIIDAFASRSEEATGGLEEMTERFAEFGQGLEGSDGLAQFFDLAGEGAETLGTLGSAALQLFLALAPIIGVGSQVALWLAQIINAVPPGVLTVVATGFTAVALGVKAYALYTSIAASVTRGWAIAQGLLNGTMALNPIALVIGLIVGLVAIVVIAWQNSERFRDIVKAAWEVAQGAISTAVTGIVSAIGWFAKLPGMVGSWFSSAARAAIRAFVGLVLWLAGMPGRTVAALAGLGGSLWRTATTAGGRLVSGVGAKVSDAVDKVRGLPGRAVRALGDLSRTLWNAGVSLIKGFVGGIGSMFGAVKNKLSSLTSALTSWKGPESLDKRILTPAGRYVIEGFQRGIDAQTPYLRSQLRGLTSDLPALTMAGQRPAQGTTPALVAPRRPAGTLSAPTPGPSAQQPVVRVIVDASDGGDDLTRWLRNRVRVIGRGNVQVAFGTGSGR